MAPLPQISSANFSQHKNENEKKKPIRTGFLTHFHFRGMHGCSAPTHITALRPRPITTPATFRWVTGTRAAANQKTSPSLSGRLDAEAPHASMVVLPFFLSLFLILLHTRVFISGPAETTLGLAFEKVTGSDWGKPGSSPITETPSAPAKDAFNFQFQFQVRGGGGGGRASARLPSLPFTW